MISKKKKTLVLKEKYLNNFQYFKFLTDTLSRMPQNFFSDSFVSEHYKHFY